MHLHVPVEVSMNAFKISSHFHIHWKATMGHVLMEVSTNALKISSCFHIHLQRVTQMRVVPVEVSLHEGVDLFLGLGMEILELVHGTAVRTVWKERTRCHCAWKYLCSRMRSVVSSNPTQGSLSLKKRKLPWVYNSCLALFIMHIHVQHYLQGTPRLNFLNCISPGIYLDFYKHN